MTNESLSNEEGNNQSESLNTSGENVQREREYAAAVSKEILRISQLEGDRRYKDELTETLIAVADDGKFRPSSDDGLYKDKEELERLCGINFDKELLYNKDTFIAFWENRYQRNDARFSLMIQLVNEEKKMHSSGIKDNRSDWVARYFDGCDIEKHDILMPVDQNPDEVLSVFEEDCALIPNLPLTNAEKSEVIRHLRVDFLEGTYPILIGKKDAASRDTMKREIMRLANASEEGQHINVQPVGISIAMQRYRLNVAQELDHETEEIKRRDEGSSINRAYNLKIEHMRQEYALEKEFLNLLPLSSFAEEDLNRMLEYQTSMLELKTNPQSRETAHNDVRELVANLPNKNEYYGDPWSVIIHLLQDYWAGRYHPDSLRRMVLKNMLKDIPKEYSDSPTGRVVSHFYLYEKFVKGSSTKNASTNASQDSILAGRAYQRDMQLIRSFHLDEETAKRAEWEYNEYLLLGKLPIAANKENSDRRAAFEKELKEYVEEGKANEFVHTTGILEYFYNYWHSVSSQN